MFLIPTLVSPECPDKIIPALCKLIERNTLLSYSSILRQGAILRFLGPYKGLLTDSDILIDKMKNLVSLVEARDDEEEEEPAKPRSVGGGSKEGEKWAGKPETHGPDSRETPRGLFFYDTISLEPTYMEIPLEGRSTPGSSDKVSRVIRIGMKCVPFKLEGVSDLLKLMSHAKNRSYAKTLFIKKSARIRKFLRGRMTDPVGMRDEFINTTPTSKELNKPAFISKLMGTGGPVYWSFLTIFTSYDFEGKDMRELLWQYRDLVNGGWGDIIVIDDIKQIINFCTQRTLACYQLHMNYLSNILSLDNVIDPDMFKKASSTGSPFSMKRKVPVSKVFESCCVDCKKGGFEKYISESAKKK